MFTTGALGSGAFGIAAIAAPTPAAICAGNLWILEVMTSVIIVRFAQHFRVPEML
jgi:hypothetical protein